MGQDGVFELDARGRVALLGLSTFPFLFCTVVLYVLLRDLRDRGPRWDQLVLAGMLVAVLAVAWIGGYARAPYRIEILDDEWLRLVSWTGKKYLKATDVVSIKSFWLPTKKTRWLYLTPTRPRQERHDLVLRHRRGRVMIFNEFPRFDELLGWLKERHPSVVIAVPPER